MSRESGVYNQSRTQNLYGDWGEELGLETRQSDQVKAKMEDYLCSQSQTKAQHEYLLANDEFCLFVKNHPKLMRFAHPLVTVPMAILCMVGAMTVPIWLDVSPRLLVAIILFLFILFIANLGLAVFSNSAKKLLWPLDAKDSFYQKDFPVDPHFLQGYNSEAEYLHSLGHKAREERIKRLKEVGKWPKDITLFPDVQSAKVSCFWRVEKMVDETGIFVWVQEWKKKDTGWTAVSGIEPKKFSHEEVVQLTEYIMQAEYAAQEKNQEQSRLESPKESLPQPTSKDKAEAEQKNLEALRLVEEAIKEKRMF